MIIPYRKDMLNSTIDYEKLIKMQSEGMVETKKEKPKVKSMTKDRLYEKRVHRGGNK